jgi:hypothetical protein
MEAMADQAGSVIPFSKCSTPKLTQFLSKLNLYSVKLVMPEFPHTEASVPQFEWQHNEDADTPRAREYLQNQLAAYGILFGSGGYQLVDVHGQKTLLSVDDPKTGQISGGTDLILCPDNAYLAELQSCVVIELKTRENVEKWTAEFCTPSNS